MKYSFWGFESIQEPFDEGAPNPGCEAQGQPIKIFFDHRDPEVHPVREMGLRPRLYKELMSSIYNIPGINAGAF
jgi:hypothetical protein